MEASPYLCEDIVEEKHCHVAANSVAVRGDGAQDIKLRGAQSGLEMI